MKNLIAAALVLASLGAFAGEEAASPAAAYPATVVVDDVTNVYDLAVFADGEGAKGA